MKAMIFAAGLGTRLKPLTLKKPKALLQYKGKILLDNAIDYLRQHGVQEIVVNVHHHADLVKQHLASHDFGLKVHISDESKDLLNTGGGLKKAQTWLKDDAFVLYNVDVLSDLNLSQLIDFHNSNNSIASLAVRKRETQRYLLFNELQELCGWENRKTSEQIIKREASNYQSLAFSGIHIIEPEIFKYIPDHWCHFSMIDLYLHLAKNHQISAYVDHSPNWIDIGKQEHLIDLS